ncbi:MAG: hypothetical protein HRU09_07570 [Oligoflexales bacterium]|nr:hypothetical protein [Oligoflexales bacterium]
MLIRNLALKSIICHACHHTWTFEPPLGRRDECPACHIDCRVCLNCIHYDPGAHHECREPQAEWVRDKDSGNFCGYFSPKSDKAQTASATNQHDKLESLFKNDSKPSDQEEKKISSLDDLFKK